MTQSVGARFCLVLILLAFSALVFHGLGSEILWNDEGLSFFIAKAGVREALVRVARDVHGPLYYAMLAAPLKFGHDLFTLRVLSAVAAITSLAFVYLSARALLGQGLGLLATTLYAIQPNTVEWAQHARPYSLQSMFVAISFWGFVQIILAPRENDRLLLHGIAAAWRQRNLLAAKTEIAWLTYTLGGGLAMLVQHPGGFYVFGCNVVIAAIFLRSPHACRRLLVYWIIAQLVLIAIWAIWLPEFVIQIREHLTPSSIEARHGNYLVGSVWPEFIALLGATHLWKLQPLPMLVNLALVAVGLVAAIRQRSSMVWIHLLIASPIALGMLGYILVHPIFGYVISKMYWITIPYTILIVYGIGALGWRPAQVLSLLVVAILNLRALQNYYSDITPARPDMIAEFITHNGTQDDGMIFDPGGSYRFSVTYYLPPDWQNLPGLDPLIAGEHVISSPTQAALQRRNWVIVEVGSEPAVPFAFLEQTSTLAMEHRFGQVIVRRYDRRG